MTLNKYRKTFEDRDFDVSNSRCDQAVINHIFPGCIAINAGNSNNGFIVFFCFGEGIDQSLRIISSGVSVDDHVFAVGYFELSFGNLLSDLHLFK